MAEMSPKMKERIAGAMAWIDEHAGKPAGELGELTQASFGAFLGELDGLTDAQWEFSPGEKQWSIKEVCLHMSRSAKGCGVSIPKLAAGKTLEGEGKPSQLEEDPGAHEAVEASIKKAFAFAAKAPASLSEDANLDTTMKHPFFGSLNCFQWAAFSIMHTNIHTRQIKRIKGSDGYA